MAEEICWRQSASSRKYICDIWLAIRLQAQFIGEGELRVPNGDICGLGSDEGGGSLDAKFQHEMSRN